MGMMAEYADDGKALQWIQHNSEMYGPGEHDALRCLIQGPGKYSQCWHPKSEPGSDASSATWMCDEWDMIGDPLDTTAEYIWSVHPGYDVDAVMVIGINQFDKKVRSEQYSIAWEDEAPVPPPSDEIHIPFTAGMGRVLSSLDEDEQDEFVDLINYLVEETRKMEDEEKADAFPWMNFLGVCSVVYIWFNVCLYFCCIRSGKVHVGCM